MAKVKEGKIPNPTISTAQSSKVFGHLVTKVSFSLDISVPIKPPTPSEKKHNYLPQQSVGQSKDLILQKLQTALFKDPISLNDTQVQQRQKQFKKLKRESQEQYLTRVKNAFSRPLMNDYFSRMYREHFYQTYQGLQVASYLQLVYPNDLQNKQVHLKQKECYKNKITIVFDLDETLIYCNESLAIPIFTIQVSPKVKIKAGINVRGGADFELMVFTASRPFYAQKVIEQLDPQKTLFSHSLYRDNCIMTTGEMYAKDLRIFNLSLSQVVLVDNASYSYTWQLDNGIPIIPFYDNKEDRELELLLKYLKGIQNCNEVREYNRNHLRLQYFQASLGPGLVFDRLFQQKMQI